ncbi:hypothetical protein [Vibrio phage vB_VaM_H2]|nr:hypothetical protein [Vibrio phage vB_VaM_H2]
MGEWISVKDKLPEHNGAIGCNEGDSVVVDVFADGERWPFCYYSFDDECWYDTDVHCSIDLVTHWMPLPEPPEVE